MRKTVAAASPDAYVADLSGWQKACVEQLRTAVQSVEAFGEVVKWRHLVYLANGPAVLIRAEEARVLLGFWRGQKLRSIEPGLKPGGKYEMATLDIRAGMGIDAARVRRLADEALALNRTLGDPTRSL